VKSNWTWFTPSPTHFMTMIPNAPRPLNDSSKPALESSFVPNTTTTSTPSQTSEVNVV
jgi:hypothetical protein